VERKNFQNKCPEYGYITHQRICLKWWMRLILGTKHCFCIRCRCYFIIIFWRSAL